MNSKALEAAWDVVNERNAYLNSPEENLRLAIAAYLDEAGTPIRWCKEHESTSNGLATPEVCRIRIGELLDELQGGRACVIVDAVLVIGGNE